MGKGSRQIVRLHSSARTGHFYSTTRSKRGNFKKIELKKFDPVIRRRVIYIEGK